MMTYQHQELAAGRWYKLNLSTQLAHVGSEVERAERWQAKENTDYAQRAIERALELLFLTIDDPKHRGRLKELTRLYEVLVDYLTADNWYHTDRKKLAAYFLQFSHAARKEGTVLNL